MATEPEALDPRLPAVIELLGRAGAKSFQIRYSDDPEPVVWIADAAFAVGRECAAALDPLKATLRLADQLVDGGTCVHCRRPTAVEHDFTAATPLDKLICWYVYDPELEKFRRSCEGESFRRVGRNEPCPCGSGVKWKHCHGA